MVGRNLCVVLSMVAAGTFIVLYPHPPVDLPTPHERWLGKPKRDKLSITTFYCLLLCLLLISQSGDYGPPDGGFTTSE
jgi:hypothetical protein